MLCVRTRGEIQALEAEALLYTAESPAGLTWVASLTHYEKGIHETITWLIDLSAPSPFSIQPTPNDHPTVFQKPVSVIADLYFAAYEISLLFGTNHPDKSYSQGVFETIRYLFYEGGESLL